MTPDPLTNLTKEKIAHRLASALTSPLPSSDSRERFPPQLFFESPRPAAVLVPLLHTNQSWHILFTRRKESLPEHSGQVAFPGGRSDDADESPTVTALREAYEEIGLQPGDVEVVGQLKPLHTITNYTVTPVVGIIPWPYSFELASVEVSRVFTIPVDWLADPANHLIQQRSLPAPYAPVPVIYFKEYDNELLWGVSAQITLDLLEALTQV